ncbi:hypothetical protein SeKA_B0063 (plasmid) [Salmonella enterica subsp. enterica serovar Kentucky str. CVM29188]|nr:hypothetical protein SeKA_B0063 [Salmonella enterica subsp. enterica serovar Kentucky str. CVM29188]
MELLNTFTYLIVHIRCHHLFLISLVFNVVNTIITLRKH